MKNLENIFTMSKQEAFKLLGEHEQAGTLTEQMERYHPHYVVKGDVMKFILLKDLEDNERII